MIVSVALMMMLAGPANDPVGAGRKAFSTCLAAQEQGGLDKKMPLPEFKALLKTKCGDKEAAFRSAILAADKADGMSAADATSDADDQVAEYVDKITSEYEDYLVN